MSEPGESSGSSASLGKRKRSEEHQMTLMELFKGRKIEEVQDLTAAQSFKPIENMNIIDYFTTSENTTTKTEAVEDQPKPTAATGQEGLGHSDESSGQVGADIIDLDSSDSDDDDDPNMDGCIYDPNSTITQTEIEPPRNFIPKCHCINGNYRVRACFKCSCSKWGFLCSPESCDCGVDCQNPFNLLDLERLFGSSPKVNMSPCFITWIHRARYRKQKMNLQHITLEWLFHILYFNGEHILADNNQAYMNWRKDWNKVAKDPYNEAVKVEAMRNLFWLAFDPDFEYGAPNGYYFNFCASGRLDDDMGAWRLATKTWHCRDCGVCVDSDEWHCSKCKKCTSSQRCGGCSGVSRKYHAWGKAREERRSKNKHQNASD